MQYYSYRLQIKNGDWLQRAGRLYQQYIVDQYAKIEQNRLNYLKFNQSSLRTELYNGAVDAIHAGDSSRDIGYRIILSFHFGKPDLFVTFTYNPKWPEITRELLPQQNAADRPDLTARVFHIKLRKLLKDLCEKYWLGKVIAYVYVIEFQKRGLPHAHILLILKPEDKLRSTDDYDSIVSTEIPDPATHPLAYKIVAAVMMHGPCGVINPSAPCIKDGVCQKHYSKRFQKNIQECNNGYPIYHKRDTGHFVETREGIQLDNRWVVPHNVKLVTKYNAHINVEICNFVLAVKYLYKYVYKGHDWATIALSQSDNIGDQQTSVPVEVDKIKMYLDARYVSASESIWRIFHYKMHGRSPNDVIEHINIHPTTLIAWFQENLESTAAREYKYTDFPIRYTWDLSNHTWNLRKITTEAIGRLYMVQPSEGERYYLRILLTHVKGATSFDDLKTVNGHMCRNFKEACILLGLL
ncbi:uncharacterized protein LOC112524872 [Rhizophagus irregularis DAOM 181602=DAOM 197198]|nr:uncharacterized protein LOC112524872 [Rhizophagus irregularis DAOM 181602=DAOM 197198]